MVCKNPKCAEDASERAKHSGYCYSCWNSAVPELLDSIGELVKACERARYLYDHLALSPLESAAKYGPDYEPPSIEDMLETRNLLDRAINSSIRSYARQEGPRLTPG
jgi:hypothetical protein